MYLFFDFDHTLADDGVVYPGLASTLLKLVGSGHKLYLCSYNPMAPRLLEEQKLYHLFSGVLQIPELDKGLAIRNYCWQYEIDIESTLFFDDERNNITCARMQGIKTHYVGHSGLTSDAIWNVVS